MLCYLSLYTLRCQFPVNIFSYYYFYIVLSTVDPNQIVDITNLFHLFYMNYHTHHAVAMLLFYRIQSFNVPMCHPMQLCFIFVGFLLHKIVYYEHNVYSVPYRLYFTLILSYMNKLNCVLAAVLVMVGIVAQVSW